MWLFCKPHLAHFDFWDTFDVFFEKKILHSCSPSLHALILNFKNENLLVFSLEGPVLVALKCIAWKKGPNDDESLTPKAASDRGEDHPGGSMF